MPYDRPNLSKDYLAGTASEDWIPLRTADFYTEHKIDVRLSTRVVSIDPVERAVALSDGGRIAFDALLIATGADPVHLDIPGAGLPHVHYLRTFDDSRDLIAKAASAKRVVVIGASFIGLETAASLRTRGIEVHVVGPQSRPLERVLGPELGDMVKSHPRRARRHIPPRHVSVGDRKRRCDTEDGRTSRRRSRRRRHRRAPGRRAGQRRGAHNR